MHVVLELSNLCSGCNAYVNGVERARELGKTHMLGAIRPERICMRGLDLGRE